MEFELVIARLLQQDDDIARLYKEQLETRVEPEVEAVILEVSSYEENLKNLFLNLRKFEKFVLESFTDQSLHKSRLGTHWLSEGHRSTKNA